MCSVYDGADARWDCPDKKELYTPTRAENLQRAIEDAERKVAELREQLRQERAAEAAKSVKE